MKKVKPVPVTGSQADLSEAFAKCYIDKNNWFEKELDAIKIVLAKEDPDYMFAAQQITSHLYGYLFYVSDKANKAKLERADVRKFVELNTQIFSKLLGKTYKTYKRDIALANFIAGLRYFGASQGQSINSLAKWAGLGKYKVERAYKINGKPTLDSPLQLYLHCCSCVLPMKNHFSDRNFPSSKPRKGFVCTNEAFTNLIEFLTTQLEQQESILPLDYRTFCEDIGANYWE